MAAWIEEARRDPVVRCTSWLFARAWPWWLLPPVVDDLVWSWLVDLEAWRFRVHLARSM